jgi:[protein-PII] uridylyltransferase
MSDAATHAASARSKGHQPLLTAELDALARSHNRHDGELRKAVAQYLKDALAEGRREAEGTLLRDRNGHRCAARLCDLQDEVIRALYHFVTTHLYASENPSEAERIAVVATGGYGRGLLAPGSDIDLLFLLPYKQTAWGESVAEAMLYALWDMGLKVGHASRSVSECIRQAKADMTIRTGLLEARYLLGDHALFDELARRFDREVMQGTAAEFVAAKLAEREERVRKVGASRYLVEPNVKDGKGGLRDLHTLFWIAKYVYRVADPEELIKHGVFDQREYKLFRRSEDFLWSVRCNMHFVAGRAEERLSFDLQREIAVRLGYTEHPGAQDVERFMKHYFLIAKDVGDLTAIMCADLEDRQAKPAPMLNRFVARLRPRQRAVRNIGDFAIDKNRITLGDPDAFARDPVNLIRMFHVAQTHELAFHPDIMRAASRSLKLIDKSLRENPEANRLFLEILTGRESEIVLRRMNEPGVLGRFIPDFGRVVSMMQFNMYHHYTVDEHLLRCIGVLASIERGDNEDRALAQQLMKTIQPENRTLLYLALFLHDIAKGRVEDHSIAGARIARRLGPRFGLAPAATETLAWLVEQHLVMSMVAQSRDLSDRRTIETFASVVQSLERLKLLTILTVADISAVGPGVFNSWKAQLLKTLYYETEPVLTGGFSEVDRAKRVAMAHDEFRAAMTEWPAEKIDAYLPRHYPAYWLKVDLPHKIRHARLLDQAKASGKSLATAAIFEPARGVTELTEIVARRSSVRPRLKAFAVEPSVAINNQWSNRYTVIEITGLDRPGFLYELTATLSRLNLNIASAHVATFGERAVDVFYVTDLMGAKIEAPQRQAAIKSALLSLLQTRRSESGQKVAAAE